MQTCRNRPLGLLNATGLKTCFYAVFKPSLFNHSTNLRLSVSPRFRGEICGFKILMIHLTNPARFEPHYLTNQRSSVSAPPGAEICVFKFF